MTEEDLDSEALVFRHIDRVMRTASLDLESMNANGEYGLNTDTWSHRVLFACEFFHAFLKPSMSDEEYKEIIEKASESVDGDGNGSFDRVDYAKHIFKEDIEHLHKENMVFQESSDLVIEDESKDTKVEPEQSEVEEEVIE